MKEQFLTLTRLERQEVNERGRILEEVCMMAPRRKKLRACDPDERRPFRGDEAFAILFFFLKKNTHRSVILQVLSGKKHAMVKTVPGQTFHCKLLSG